MAYFLLTAEKKEFFVEAEWAEQAVEYFKWVRDFDGDVKVREIEYLGEIDFYCPIGWSVPVSRGSELIRNRDEWLKNYLGKFYEVYKDGNETPEFIEFMKFKGWQRECPYYGCEEDKWDDDQENPDAAYTNSEHIWGNYPIILQGLTDTQINEAKTSAANNLLNIRTRAGLTQQELAAKTGIAQPRIAKYERLDDLSNVTIGVLQKIADACGASIADIIKERDI